MFKGKVIGQFKTAKYMLYLNEIKLHYPGVYVAILHLLKIEMVYNTIPIYIVCHVKEVQRTVWVKVQGLKMLLFSTY